jgi:deoxyribonuclease IV
MNNSRLRFGTAGSPLSTTTKGRSGGVHRSIELGLGAQELEFVHGVNLSEEEANKINTLVNKHDFSITAHGPYYVNLNAQEPSKVSASIQRILATARAAKAAGGKSITFHPGFYLGQGAQEVYSIIRERMNTIMEELQLEDNKVRISPETTGKPTQFGSLHELVRLAQDVEGLGICVDFAHLHARSNGAYNTKEEFRGVLSHIEKELGTDQLKNMHIHLSGINYGEKGEKNHLVLEQSDLRWKELLTELKEHHVGGIVICESPNMEEDALLLQRNYQEL